MANVLKMANVEAIQRLHALQWSARRIARELEIDRGTVGRYLKQSRNEPKPAISPTGSSASKPATFPGLPAPASGAHEDSDHAERKGIANSAISPTGSDGESAGALAPACVGRRSACEPHRELIQAKLDQGLSAQRIHQDLVSEHGLVVSYDSVKRFARRLRGRELPMRRMECLPGEEAQVDFGTGAAILTPDGQRRKTWVFRIVLSHSRKAYSEATFRQTTEDFLRCLENAFWHFGGVTKTVVIDNLKSAVAHERLVRSRTGPQAGGLLPSLRHGDPPHAATHAAA